MQCVAGLHATKGRLASNSTKNPLFFKGVVVSLLLDIDALSEETAVAQVWSGRWAAVRPELFIATTLRTGTTCPR